MICDILNYPIVIISFILIVLGSIYYFNKSNTTTLKDNVEEKCKGNTCSQKRKNVTVPKASLEEEMVTSGQPFTTDMMLNDLKYTANKSRS